MKATQALPNHMHTDADSLSFLKVSVVSVHVSCSIHRNVD